MFNLIFFESRNNLFRNIYLLLRDSSIYKTRRYCCQKCPFKISSKKIYFHNSLYQ